MRMIFQHLRYRTLLMYVSMLLVSVSFLLSSCDNEEDSEPAPSITSVSPDQGQVGTSVTITGTNLANTTEVKFNGTTATITSTTSTTIVTTVPAGATSGKIMVKTSGGEATSSNDFTVLAPSPSIASFSPASGVVGTEVTVTGTNFTGATEVKFNGTSAANFTVQSATTIVVSVPSGATSGKITVKTASGEASSEGDFTVTEQSTPNTILISDFDEENADALWGTAEDGGTELTIKAIESEDGNSFFHLKGSDANTNYWLGGRYFEVGPSDPFGIEETDITHVWMNVDVKSNNASSVGKLVYTVVEQGAPDNRRNFERDFDVTWNEWKTISIRVDKFGYWNGSGMTEASTVNPDITTIWSIALYLRGGSTDVYDLSFDNVRFSEGGPLGEEIEGHF